MTYDVLFWLVIKLASLQFNVDKTCHTGIGSSPEIITPIVSVKNPPLRFSEFFPKRLEIFNYFLHTYHGFRDIQCRM